MAVKRQTKKSAASTRPQFCTECGESLEGFWLEQESDDIKGLIQRMARCKAEGRFHGKFCARLWIAGTETPQLAPPAKRTPRGKVASLKASIGKKLAGEPRRTRPSSTRSR